MSSRVFARLHRALLREAGVSLPDFEILEALAGSPEERLRAYELGAELQWEKSRLSHHLKRMVNRGLVGRSACESDGRGMWIGVTEAGRAAWEAAVPVYDQTVRALVLGIITDEQAATLGELSEKVLADLPAEADACEG
jgi:DNA-binding MarR family transcriptional regulator